MPAAKKFFEWAGPPLAALWITVFLVGAAAAPCRAQIFTPSTQISEFSFSPNGDGVQDSTLVLYELSDSATVDIVVLEADSVTPVDTLLVGVIREPDSLFTAPWHGTLASGAPAPDAAYVVFLRGESATDVDSVYFRIRVDRVKPQATITNVEPRVFAPDVLGQPNDVSIDYTLFDPPPSDTVNVTIRVITPTNQEEATLADSRQAAVGSFRVTWVPANPTTLTDGNYSVTFNLSDDAGNTTVASSTISVDKLIPKISFYTPPVVGTRVDTIRGYAWDRNGVAAVEFQHPDSVNFHPVPWSAVISDTTFFKVFPVADRLVEGDTITWTLKAVDVVTREAVLPFGLSLDTIPPDPVVLDPPPVPVRTPTYTITGSVPGDAELMNVFRNDTLLTTLLLAAGQFPLTVSLFPGPNRYYVTVFDEVDNESPPSNEIDLIYDTGAGFFITQPFRPNDAFQVNLTKNSQAINLRIYDLSGRLVRLMRRDVAATMVSIPWDGLNGDRQSVKRGPLAAVLEVTYEDGGREIIRELFLFDPD